MSSVRSARPCRQPVHVDALGDDVGDRHAWVEARVRVLEDHLRILAKRHEVRATQARDVLPLEPHDAVGELGEPQDAAGAGRLAAARLAGQAHALATVDLERHAVDGLEHLVGTDVVVLADALRNEQRLRAHGPGSLTRCRHRHAPRLPVWSRPPGALGSRAASTPPRARRRSQSTPGGRPRTPASRARTAPRTGSPSAG